MKTKDLKNVKFIREVLQMPHFTKEQIPEILANMDGLKEMEYVKFMEKPLRPNKHKKK